MVLSVTLTVGRGVPALHSNQVVLIVNLRQDESLDSISWLGR